MAKNIPSLLLLPLVVACDNDPKPREILPASPSAIASTLGIDASQLAVVVDPDKPAGDLAADLAAFTTVEACMKQRAASLDPLVGDAVDAIGYDTFLRDACRSLEAAKSHDPKKCELIDASSLRLRCRTVTAMVAGDADGCPLKAPSRPELGRDATCVAAALRSPAMCAGAQKRDRPACDALLAHDAKRCDALALEDQRTPCVRDATRFRAVLVGSPTLAAVPPVKATLTLHGDGRGDPSQTSVDLEQDLGAGVVLVQEGARRLISFGRVGGVTSATPRATQPLERTRLSLAFTVGHERPSGSELGSQASLTSDNKPQVTESALTVAGATETSCTGATCTLTVAVTKLEPKRAGVLQMTVDGTLGGYRVHADIETFVRDLVTPP